MTNGIYPSNAGLAHNRKSIKIIPHIKLKKYTIISKDVKKTFYKTHIHLWGGREPTPSNLGVQGNSVHPIKNIDKNSVLTPCLMFRH